MDTMRRMFPKMLADTYHRLCAVVADVWFGHPSQRMLVIGITGTNGKTTTTHLLAEILRAAGRRVGFISTIAICVGGQEIVNETKMTSLKNAWQIQKTLARMVVAGDTVAIVETTSHALDQLRVHRVRYDGAIFLNATHEHIDYHKTMEAYVVAKERLFTAVAKRKRKVVDGNALPRVLVTNVDDPFAERFLQFPADERWGVGTGDPPFGVIDAFFLHYDILDAGSDHTIFHVRGREVTLHMPGAFLVTNACVAMAAALAFGVRADVAIAALETASAYPGRMERIDAGQPFWVIIDYAVTPDAFEKLSAAIRAMIPEGGKFWWVFGATGERDQSKRPVMGEIAGRTASRIVLTNEDPWREDPDAIVDMLEAGVKKAGKIKNETYWRIMDRRQAIDYACAHAGPNDIVVITGKGAETSMAIGKEKVPWNERAIVRERAGRYAK